jgi:hypothetical protein
MRHAAVLCFLAGLVFLAPGSPAQEASPVQMSATPPVAVLDVPWVWRHWKEYVEIIDYVERIKEMDRRDLEGMRDEALEMAAEADERFRAGELLEKDYRIQKAAIGARLRKLQNYWEIREEIINNRLAEDEQNRLDRMQDVVDDLGFSGIPFIIKGRASAYHDDDLELAPRISETLNDIDRIEAQKAAETAEAARILEPSAAGESDQPGGGEEAPEAAGGASGTPSTVEGAETGERETVPHQVPSEPAAEKVGPATDE